MTATLRPHVQPTYNDVICIGQRFDRLIEEFLRAKGLPFTADGFPATALTGDEDPETMALIESLRPLADLGRAIKALPLWLQKSDKYNTDCTWHSNQYDVLACTGEESDGQIAQIYRDSLE